MVNNIKSVDKSIGVKVPPILFVKYRYWYQKYFQPKYWYRYLQYFLQISLTSLLSGASCRFAYGPADATATHCLLLQKIQTGFGYTFLVPAHPGNPEQNPESHKIVAVVVVVKGKSESNSNDSVNPSDFKSAKNVRFWQHLNLDSNSNTSLDDAAWNGLNTANFVKIVQGICPRGAFIFKNLVKFSVFRVLYPYCCNDGVKFGMEEWTKGSLVCAKFHPISEMYHPCGAKNHIITLWELKYCRIA